MADISVRSSDKIKSDPATTLGTGYPVGTTAGDLFIIAVACNNAVNLTSTGTNTLTRDYQVTFDANMTAAIFSRRIQAGDTAWQISQDGAADRMAATLVTFQNPDPSTIYNVSPSAATENEKLAGGGTTITATAVNTTVDKCIACIAYFCDGATNTISGPGGTWTEQQNTGDAQGVSFNTKTISPAGSSGGPNGTLTQDLDAVSITLAVANTAGAGTVSPNVNETATITEDVTVRMSLYVPMMKLP